MNNNNIYLTSDVSVNNYKYSNKVTNLTSDDITGNPIDKVYITRTFFRYTNGLVVNEQDISNTDINFTLSTEILNTKIGNTTNTYIITSPSEITMYGGIISDYVPYLLDNSNTNHQLVTLSSTTPSYHLSGSIVKFVWNEHVYGTCKFNYMINVVEIGSSTNSYLYEGEVTITLLSRKSNSCDV